MCLTALLVLTGCNRTQTKSSTNEPSIEADKTETVMEDKFRTIQDSTYFRSKEKEHDEYNGDYYYYSEQDVDIQWPEQLVGCMDITPLQKALIAKGFGKKPPSTDIDSVVQKFTGTALFLKAEENLTAVPVQASDVEGGMTSLSAGVSIRPFLSSPTLIGFRIHKNDYQGGAHGYYSMEHLIFDKANCAVVDSAYIFNPAQHNHLIGKINHYITKKCEMYMPVDYIPDFFLSQQGLVFVFQPYEIASYAEGIIQIEIPYTDLEQLITPQFKKLLKEASQIHIDQENKKQL